LVFRLLWLKSPRLHQLLSSMNRSAGARLMC
jgi:hypothetical protein